MLVQEAEGRILLLPAWPADWDTEFKLHLENRTVIEGVVKDGSLVRWDIEPASRRTDVVVYKPQVAPVKPLVAANKHPLRVGVDSTGSILFKGDIGRVSLFKCAVSAKDVMELAGGEREKRVQGNEDLAFSVLNPEAGGALTDNQNLFAGEFSLEIWIKPAKGEQGRILDKLTAGKNDGFLVDCHPGESLRVITARDTVVHQGVLKSGKWHHVAVVFSRSDSSLYLDGVKL
jgi:hypothetical protein